MWQTIILSFLAGMMGGNAIPHFIKGITKENYPNVLGNSAVPNFVSGWAAFVITVLLVHGAQVEQHPLWAFISGAIGVLVIGLFHAGIGAFGRKS
jgi:uncharacterized membrane protein YdcZ (DUF606 family)